MDFKGQYISKYEIENIWNINFSQNTNEWRYPEQLYRLGMFMFWQIAVARPLSSASLTYLVCNYFSGKKNKFVRLFFGRSFGMTILFRDLLTLTHSLALVNLIPSWLVCRAEIVCTVHVASCSAQSAHETVQQNRQQVSRAYCPIFIYLYCDPAQMEKETWHVLFMCLLWFSFVDRYA